MDEQKHDQENETLKRQIEQLKKIQADYNTNKQAEGNNADPSLAAVRTTTNLISLPVLL